MSTISSIFAKNGILVKRLKKEHRPQQERLAIAIENTFSKGGNLLAEAGTGVGKSLAYLVPGIIEAVKSGRKFVVSTHTKSLQEQLLVSELPFVRKLFREAEYLHQYADFKSSILLGKTNYLCTTRLGQYKKALEHSSELDDVSAYSLLEAISSYIENNRDFDGIREHLPIQVPDSIWTEINADSASCNTRHCRGGTCYYHKAKAAVEEADIVILNHRLLFSIISNEKSAKQFKKNESYGIVFENDIVVFDEAHKVREVAEEAMGFTVSNTSCQNLLKVIKSQCRVGYAFASGDMIKIHSLLETAKGAINLFFNKLAKNYLVKDRVVARLLREPNWATDTVTPALDQLAIELKKIVDGLEDKSLRASGKEVIDRLTATIVCLNDALNLTDNELYAYWIEATGKKQVSIMARPIDISAALEYYLFNCSTGLVLASATLTDSPNSMQRMKSLLGAESDKVEVLIEQSPFDYDTNMEVFISNDCPDDYSSYENLQYNASVIERAVKNLSGGTIVLCTSYKQCNELAELVSKSINRPIYVQGKDYSRSQIIEMFKSDGNALLFGTSSFWTGIDIPGAALQQVIITKMPFLHPDYPFVRAKCEYLERIGCNSFYNLMVPEAVMQFRQGIGRLIRTATDRGRLIITDSRLVKKSYGRSFFSAIPTKKRKYFTASEIINLF